MKKEWYAKKWITMLIHALVWILVFSLPYLLRPSYNPNEGKPPIPRNSNIIFVITRISDLLIIIFFYFNAELLIVRLLYKKKYAFYAASVIISFVCYVLIVGMLRKKFITTEFFSWNRHIFFSTFIFLFILS